MLSDKRLKHKFDLLTMSTKDGHATLLVDLGYSVF